MNLNSHPEADAHEFDGLPQSSSQIPGVNLDANSRHRRIRPSTSPAKNSILAAAQSSRQPVPSTSSSTAAIMDSRPTDSPDIQRQLQQPLRQIPVGVLGATGTVGQRFILLLSKHPWFVLTALGASERSAGLEYQRAVKWKQTDDIPATIRKVVVTKCDPREQGWNECKIVFSGLDADVAGPIESAFRLANLPIFSNARNYRRDPHVPLLVPYVNPSHFAIIPQQQHLLNLSLSADTPAPSPSPPGTSEPLIDKGFIVTNANCSTTGLVIPIHALERSFGPIEALICTTMQAISGAGYPGVPSLDILANVVPYIPGEEDKIEWETLKILGGLTEDGDGLKAFDMHSKCPMRVSAGCNRVPVLTGHTIAFSVRFAKRPPPSPQQVREALSAFTCEAQTLGCPSAPRRIIRVFDSSIESEKDRPQPRLDAGFEGGAGLGVTVGRVRQCQVLDIKMVTVSDNVGIGAAGSGIVNAELAVLKGIIS